MSPRADRQPPSDTPACERPGCGLPIVRGEHLPWVHAINPGIDHHYVKPNAVARRMEGSNGTD